MECKMMTLVVFLVTNFYCTGLNRVPYDIVPQIGKINWDYLLSNKGPIKLITINTGKIKVPVSGMLNMKHEKMEGESDRIIEVDVLAHLLRHPIKGDILIDTGFDSSFSGKNRGNLSGVFLSNYVKGFSQNEGQDIASQLKVYKADPKAVLFTHLHSDHTSGVPALNQNIPLFAGKDAEYINVPLLYSNTHFENNNKIKEIDCKQAIYSSEAGSVIDFYGDNSLFILCTPGHSKGHLSYLILTQEGPVLLVGDVSHTKKGFIEGIEPGWVSDRALAVQSLNNLKQFVNKYNQVKVIYGHEI